MIARAIAFVLVLAAPAMADRVGKPVPVVTTQTLVFVRHGEKPPAGLGQLSPQGLLRALALPDVLLPRFGRPDFIFAPSPAVKVKELNTGKYYDYIRPLATIEPTAVRCELPVNASIGYTDVAALRRELGRAKYRNAKIFLAWEHLQICALAREFFQRHGLNPDLIPQWHEKDFDSIYIVTITRRDGRVAAIRFDHQYEGLNNVSPARIKLTR